MANKDALLEQYISEMDSLQREIDYQKSCLSPLRSRRDSIKSEIGSLKYQIADLRSARDQERDAARYCYQQRDHYSASSHKYNAQSLSDSIADKRSILDGYYDRLNEIKRECDLYYEQLNSARERKNRVRELYNSRLQEVRIERAAERAKWAEKNCKACGSVIRYRIDWSHIPNYCKSCKSSFGR